MQGPYEVPAIQSLSHECRGPGRGTGASWALQAGFRPPFSHAPYNIGIYLPGTVQPPFTTSKAPSRHPPFVLSLFGEVSSHCAPFASLAPHRTPAAFLLEAPRHSALSRRNGCGQVLLSSLSLYWLLLPSDIQPFSFLQAVTAFQGSCGGGPHSVSGWHIVCHPQEQPLWFCLEHLAFRRVGKTDTDC